MFYYQTTKGGCIQVLPARLQMSLPQASEFYVATLGLYLDAIFDRSDSGKATVLIDVRPGKGWPNPPAHKMVGFIRHVASELNDLFPDRLSRCVLYPIPGPAVFLWKLVRGFLDKKLVEQVVLIPGSERMRSKPPNEKLSRFVDPNILTTMEKTRLDLFQST